MLHGVMLGPVMFSCLFGGARHGLYITLNKVSHKQQMALSIIHHVICHILFSTLLVFIWVLRSNVWI